MHHVLTVTSDLKLDHHRDGAETSVAAGREGGETPGMGSQWRRLDTQSSVRPEILWNRSVGQNGHAFGCARGTAEILKHLMDVSLHLSTSAWRRETVPASRRRKPSVNQRGPPDVRSRAVRHVCE